jgi:hypothetical protein
MSDELAKSVQDAASYGLKFAADKQRLSLHAVDEAWVASVVAKHALTAAVHAGEMIDIQRHKAEVDRLKRRESQLSNAWAGAKVEADRQLQRVQSALADLGDRKIAESLAEKIGVILPAESDALFEENAA